MKQPFIELGQAVRELERLGITSAKEIIQKYNPSNTPEGFLYHAEDAMKLSNEITELAALHNVTLPVVPVLSAQDIDDFERGGSNEKQAFFFGLNGGKRSPGRPKGSVKAEGRKKTHGITISDDAWAKAEATENASAYIERLILADA